MTDSFPENEVEVLRSYLSDDLHQSLVRTKAELQRIRVGEIPDPDALKGEVKLSAGEEQRQKHAIRVNRARGRFLDLLNRTHLGEEHKPGAIVAIEESAQDIMHLDFLGALNILARFNEDEETRPVADLAFDRATTEESFTSDAIVFLTAKLSKVIVTPHDDDGQEIWVSESHSLQGFSPSARLTSGQIEEFLTLLDFLSDTPERTFRLGIMLGEARFGLGAYDLAIQEFGKLRQTTGASVRGKFVALRSGFAHLSLGDSLFRRFRAPDDAVRDQIRAAYAEAARQAGSNQISSGNPLRQQVEGHAAMQREKLDAGFNFLGYRDGYVPILRPATLQGLAEHRIQTAADAVQKFELFRSRADQIQDQLRDLDFERDVKEVEGAIAQEHIGKANDQLRIAGQRIDQIQAQLDSLDTGLLASLAGSLVGAGASAFLSGASDTVIGSRGTVIGTSVPGVVGALSGGVSALANYSARKTELEFQKKIAEIERGIAQRDVRIAELGQQIVEATIDFLGEKIRRIQNRELNPDLYYSAAAVFRVMAQHHLDVAILWSYLFERAVSFLRVEPDLRQIRLDYLGGPGGLLTAPDRLRSDLDDVIDRNVPITKGQSLTETYSLRTWFPLEFNRFLQTGRMDFTLSLYELSKRRPGVYRQRIKRVEVKLQFPPPSGFTGRIRHRGSFLLRDKDTTPEPGAGSFIPSGDQLGRAFAELGAGASQGTPVDGVIPYLLDVDTLELSPDEPIPDTGSPEPDALVPIEGYGPAGDWTLEVENVDLRFISDALLRITYVIPESDEPLADKVKKLITSYEQDVLVPGDALDLISPYSLRQQFPDTLAQLGSGSAQLTMAATDFPAGITDRKLKTIVVQAVDADKKGVADLMLEISGRSRVLVRCRSHFGVQVGGCRLGGPIGVVLR
ncbi:hypothetical protein ABT174_32265, partial [Streptomyces sparsogenes]|uniref:Tc toxin subunit A-related protein n=1 Tax=Streptomyces sparsogenes TaxID=67365 RepID=UPI0033319A80